MLAVDQCVGRDALKTGGMTGHTARNLDLMVEAQGFSKKGNARIRKEKVTVQNLELFGIHIAEKISTTLHVAFVHQTARKE